MHSERVTFLTTPDRKAALAARAAARGVSVGEYVRRRIEDEDEPTPEQEAELATLVRQVNEAIPKMHEAIDDMTASIRRSREHIRATLEQMSGR